ncbi:MAG TPA: hypothetical protein VFX59_08150 [Polyangiales bacterium]|nr:hypothetical protein [Polyangiales bacterium]
MRTDHGYGLATRKVRRRAQAVGCGAEKAWIEVVRPAWSALANPALVVRSSAWAPRQPGASHQAERGGLGGVLRAADLRVRLLEVWQQHAIGFPTAHNEAATHGVVRTRVTHGLRRALVRDATEAVLEADRDALEGEWLAWDEPPERAHPAAVADHVGHLAQRADLQPEPSFASLRLPWRWPRATAQVHIGARLGESHLSFLA